MNRKQIIAVSLTFVLLSGCQPFAPKTQPSTIQPTDVIPLPTQKVEVVEEPAAPEGEIPPEELVKTAMAMVPLSTPPEIALTQMPQLLETKFPEPPLPQKGPDTAPGLPADIPVFSPNENLLVSDNQISYIALMDYSTVLEFYKTGMPANGWNRAGASAVEDQNAASLIYQKESREATIEIKRDGEKASVLIGFRNL